MAKVYKPKEFAKLIGRSVNTLQRWDRDGILVAHRTVTNRRYYTHEQYLAMLNKSASQARAKTFAYIRISAETPASELLSQRKTIENYCTEHRWEITDYVEDIGSALDYTREGFCRLMLAIEQQQCERIVLVHEDRLVRFGYEWIQEFCQRHGVELINLNHRKHSPDSECEYDFHLIADQFSDRLSTLHNTRRQVHYIRSQPKKLASRKS